MYSLIFRKNSWLAGFITCLILSSFVMFAVHSLQAQSGLSKKEDFNIYSLDLSKETLEKIKSANDALIAAMEALKNEGKYAAASDIPNATLILSGGGNSLQDLENGLGVDPETYCLLYANLGAVEILDKLTTDDQGRLLYNNKVVKLLSPEKMKSVGARRKAFNNYNPFSTNR